jgi:hypothetical protein
MLQRFSVISIDIRSYNLWKYGRKVLQGRLYSVSTFKFVCNSSGAVPHIPVAQLNTPIPITTNVLINHITSSPVSLRR